MGLCLSVWMGSEISKGVGVTNSQDEPGSPPGLKAEPVLAMPGSLWLASPNAWLTHKAQFEWKLVLRLAAIFPSVLEVPDTLVMSSRRMRLRLLSFQKNRRQFEETPAPPFKGQSALLLQSPCRTEA